jgi:alkanesulfonate monooxygenase SsuD/methylene tetrahydromethanopterin reductase-like flavin-dependent oxidoreductase (luciferase family)
MTSFGLHVTTYPELNGPTSLAAYLHEVGDTLESTGVFSTLWLSDHVQHLGPEGPHRPMPESHLVLAAVAAHTTTLHLGILATSVLYRPPALLAKMITTIDALSGGRAILGIGAGHPRTEAEHLAYGYAFPPVGERMAILDDALETIRSMTGPLAVAGAPPNWPRPVDADGIPILVAGSGEQRLLRIAAHHADMINLSFPSGDTIERLPHKLDVLARHCATVGRDPATITVTYKALLAVEASRAEAAEAGERWCAPRGLTGLDQRSGVFVGEPTHIAEQVRPFLDAGVEHLVIELAAGADAKTISLAAEALAPLIGDRT